MTIFSAYELVKRIVEDLEDGKASMQVIGRSGDTNVEDIFDGYERDFINKCKAYLIDLRRQIRNQIEADEAEQLIDKATEGIGNGQK